MSETRDQLLGELSSVRLELLDTPPDDFATRHALHVRADELRRRLLETEPPLTSADRSELLEQLAALRALHAEYIRIMREERWGTQLPVWLYWRRLLSKPLSLENRPSYPVRRTPAGGSPPRRFARYSPSNLPVLLQFQPEIQEINQRIAVLEERLSPKRARKRRVRLRRRHVHPDDGGDDKALG